MCLFVIHECLLNQQQMSHHMRKPKMWFLDRSDKPSYTNTEDGYWLEVLDLERKRIVPSLYRRKQRH